MAAIAAKNSTLITSNWDVVWGFGSGSTISQFYPRRIRAEAARASRQSEPLPGKMLGSRITSTG